MPDHHRPGPFPWPFALTGLWSLGVLAWAVAGLFTLWHRNSEPMLAFWLGQSGVVSSSLFASAAWHRGRWLGVLAGSLSALLLALFLFLYFPMGPAECQEWVQAGIRRGEFHLP